MKSNGGPANIHTCTCHVIESIRLIIKVVPHISSVLGRGDAPISIGERSWCYAIGHVQEDKVDLHFSVNAGDMGEIQLVVGHIC